jgi:hypothetical protein
MTNRSRLVLAAFFAGSVASPMAIAQAQGITSQQAEAILDELKQIHQLLLRQQAAGAPAPPQALPVDEKVSLVLEPGGYSIGRADAPFALDFSLDMRVRRIGQIPRRYRPRSRRRAGDRRYWNSVIRSRPHRWR